MLYSSKIRVLTLDLHQIMTWPNIPTPKLYIDMKLLRSTFQLALIVLCAASQANDLYLRAIDTFRHLPHKYDAYKPVYTKENIDSGVWIPQYDEAIQDYITNYEYKPQEGAFSGISMLQEAAEAGSSEAASTLGDIYTFGNFSIPVNYTKAISYYHKSVSLEANGHAYFMLGFMYSTGMFGEIPSNKQRAAVYYDIAAKNDDFNALLVLAYRHLHGIECAMDCSVSKFYYSAAARKTRSVLAHHDLDLVDDYITYDIALPDYNGGIYGRRVSESPLTISNRISGFLSVRESLRDKNINSQDTEIIDYYFDAYESFHGGHFNERNYTEAFQDAISCVVHAGNKFDGPYFDLATQIDKFIWSRCLTLLSRMYSDGLGVNTNMTKAYIWLRQAEKLYNDKLTQFAFAAFHRHDPSYAGTFTSKAIEHLLQAATNGSSIAAFFIAKLGIAPKLPIQTSYSKNHYDLMKFAAKNDVTLALFYYADAVESGFAASMGDKYDCEQNTGFFKAFVEESERYMLPHIHYAFEEFRYGNYKNALLGYLIAAEQGLASSQVTAAYLLYQLDPILSWNHKTYLPERIRSAFGYLELASAQNHLDATILLGDLYCKGFEEAGLPPDHSKAFAYYSKAALSASGHGCYKLGYMYEYGLGSPNSTIDYFMAKRYYDMSRKYYTDKDLSQQITEAKASTFPVTLALLRLRFKMLFHGAKSEKGMESPGWLSTFKRLAKSDDKGKENNAQAKSEAHSEGSTYEGEDEYETFDYIVLILTIAFFLYMAVENLRGQFRRMGGRQNNADDQAAGNREQAPRFRVEFFFAI